MNTLLAERICRLRNERGLSQADVAKSLGVSRPSYIDIEKGKKELTLSQLRILASLLRIPPEELQFEIAMIASNDISMPKFKQVILNCVKFGGAESDGKITKTKLAKLVYLSEFKWFYDNLQPLTGLAYKRLAQGPVPDAYFRAIDELFEEKLIDIQKKGSAFMIALNENASNNLLTADELVVVTAVSKKWRASDTQQIVAFTHKQLPWKICRPGEVIPYELITQEDPENVF